MAASHSSVLPNFLIVGAAKCGTSSIATYLNQHPAIYLSPIKEPKFISSQFIRSPLRGRGDAFIEGYSIKTFQEYRRLFRNVREETAIGEASVENLYYYRQAIPLIGKLFGDVRIIIVLRNPVDRAFSAYKNMLRDMREELTFEEGLRQEERRRRENWEFLWSYTDVGFYSKQVAAYLDSFSRVKICLFDDFVRDGVAFIQDLFRFLEVDSSFRPNLDYRVNTSGVPVRNALVRRLFRASGLKGSVYKFLAMNGFPEELIFLLVEYFRRMIMTNIKIKPETRSYLLDLYREDILALQGLLKRPLYGWLK